MQIEYKDEVDLMLEKLEKDDDLESNTISLVSDKKIRPRDTLVKESVTIITLNDCFSVKIRETLKFRSPKAY